MIIVMHLWGITMIREYKRILHRKTTIYFVYAVIAIFCGLTIRLITTAKDSKSLSDYIGYYNTYEKLYEYYNLTKESINEVYNGMDESLIEEKIENNDRINKRLIVFEYLLKNYVNSEDAVIYSEGYPFVSKDIVSINFSYSEYITYMMILISIFLVVYILTGDFTGERHRMLYTGYNRMKILREKFVTYITLNIIVMLILEILGGIFASIFADKVKVILLTINGKVYGIKPCIMWILETISLLFQLLPYFVLFFSIGVFLKNDLLTPIICIGLFLFEYYFGGKTGKVLFVTGPFYYSLYGTCGTIKEWMFSYIRECVLVFIVLSCSFYNFKKAHFR